LSLTASPLVEAGKALHEEGPEGSAGGRGLENIGSSASMLDKCEEIAEDVRLVLDVGLTK
jgi:hypothetical protein